MERHDLASPSWSLSQRQQTTADPDIHARVESLLTTFSSVFLNTPESALDRQIDTALRRLVEACACDCGSLAEWSQELTTWRTKYWWGRPEVVAPPEAGAPASTALPWYASQLRQGHVVCFTCLDEVPSAAGTETQYWRRLGLQALLAMPLSVDGRVTYVLSLATWHAVRDWPGTLIRRLHLMGELFANALVRKKAEHTTCRLWQELAHTARVTMLGELTASLVHELNQPLAAILSNAQAAQRFLARKTPPLAEVREVLTDIIADDQRAGMIIQQLRDFGKKGSPARAPVDVNALVQQIVQLVRREALGLQVALVLELTPDLPASYGDCIQLHQVLLNLVLNACEAMRHTTDRPRQLVLRTACADGTLTVSLQDTGGGVDKATLQHMFTAFFTTKADGMGLGLAISRSIIEAHGGRIWALSKPGQGTTVCFTLPCREEAAG
jgi:signal transduction histidine kinase